MERLGYSLLEKTGYEGYLLKDAPERVLQFGEGGFLRAFCEDFIDTMNQRAGFDSKIVVCQPIAGGLCEALNEQQGLYTLCLRGFSGGKEVSEHRVISAISRCINPYHDFGALLDCAKNPDLRFVVSNTTEAGIVFDESCRFSDAPPNSFPAKLTRLLFERWQEFGSEPSKGFVILSCELIENNGQELKKCVLSYCELWALPPQFARWIERENLFCSTLVDRIVTGYPKAEAQALCSTWGYEDTLIDTGELFGFWAIEGPESLYAELPVREAGLPVLITDDIAPYKQRKVRILNGAHTTMVLAAYLSGQNIVRDSLRDPVLAAFLKKAVDEEILPTLTLPECELREFAQSVSERFLNPFIDHQLISIALNSTSKWKARVLPSVRGYLAKFGRVPPCLTFGFAAYLAFYRCERLTNEGMLALRGEEEYQVCDERAVLEFFAAHRADDAPTLVQSAVLSPALWGEPLPQLPGFSEAATSYLACIWERGMYEALKTVVR